MWWTVIGVMLMVCVVYICYQVALIDELDLYPEGREALDVPSFEEWAYDMYPDVMRFAPDRIYDNEKYLDKYIQTFNLPEDIEL
jgi:hypothetical protein